MTEPFPRFRELPENETHRYFAVRWTRVDGERLWRDYEANLPRGEGRLFCAYGEINPEFQHTYVVLPQ